MKVLSALTRSAYLEYCQKKWAEKVQGGKVKTTMQITLNDKPAILSIVHEKYLPYHIHENVYVVKSEKGDAIQVKNVSKLEAGQVGRNSVGMRDVTVSGTNVFGVTDGKIESSNHNHESYWEWAKNKEIGKYVVMVSQCDKQYVELSVCVIKPIKSPAPEKEEPGDSYASSSSLSSISPRKSKRAKTGNEGRVENDLSFMESIYKPTGLPRRHISQTFETEQSHSLADDAFYTGIQFKCGAVNVPGHKVWNQSSALSASPWFTKVTEM